MILPDRVETTTGVLNNLGDLITADNKIHNDNDNITIRNLHHEIVRDLLGIPGNQTLGKVLTGELSIENCNQEEISIFEISRIFWGKDFECKSEIPPLPANDYWKMLLLMKYFNPHSGHRESPVKFLSYFNKTNSLLGFPLKTNTTEDFLWDKESIIPVCTKSKFPEEIYLESSAKSTCDAFLPVPTNVGICYAFNGPHPARMLIPSSEYYKGFLMAYEAEYHRTPIDRPLTLASDDLLMSFYVVHNQRHIVGRNQPLGPLYLRISDALSFFNFKSSSIKLERGMESIIYVKPTNKVSEGIEHLPFYVRRCRFSHEVIKDELSIFSFYSKESCVQECKIHHSMNSYGCIPWEIPLPLTQRRLPICDLLSSKRFYRSMENTSFEDMALCQNRCLSDCSSLTFEVVRLENRALDRSKMCLYFNNLGDKTRGNLFSASGMANVLSALLSYETKDNVMDVITCADMVEDVTFVFVRFSSSSFTQYVQTQRVDFSAKFSFIGGTLGLFTGMSFLSFVEAAFWLLKNVSLKMARP